MTAPRSGPSSATTGFVRVPDRRDRPSRDPAVEPELRDLVVAVIEAEAKLGLGGVAGGEAEGGAAEVALAGRETRLRPWTSPAVVVRRGVRSAASIRPRSKSMAKLRSLDSWIERPLRVAKIVASGRSSPGTGPRRGDRRLRARSRRSAGPRGARRRRC